MFIKTRETIPWYVMYYLKLLSQIYLIYQVSLRFYRDYKYYHMQKFPPSQLYLHIEEGILLMTINILSELELVWVPSIYISLRGLSEEVLRKKLKKDHMHNAHIYPEYF